MLLFYKRDWKLESSTCTHFRQVYINAFSNGSYSDDFGVERV